MPKTKKVLKTVIYPSKFLGLDIKYLLGAGFMVLAYFAGQLAVNSLLPEVDVNPASINMLSVGDGGSGGGTIKCGPNQRVKKHCLISRTINPALHNETSYNKDTQTWDPVRNNWKIVRECVPVGCININRKGL